MRTKGLRRSWKLVVALWIIARKGGLSQELHRPMVCGSSSTESYGSIARPSPRLSDLPRMWPVMPDTLIMALLAALPDIVGSTNLWEIAQICAHFPF